jgi:hypothetical protein
MNREFNWENRTHYRERAIVRRPPMDYNEVEATKIHKFTWNWEIKSVIHLKSTRNDTKDRMKVSISYD